MADDVTIRFGGKTDDFRRASKVVKSELGELKSVATKALSFGLTGVGVSNLLREFDRLGKLGKRFRLPVETLQGFSQVAKEGGVSIETIAKAMTRANKSAQDARNGLSTAVRAFAALNLEVEEFSRLDAEGQFLAVADAVAKHADRNVADAAALDILGRSAGDLLPLLQQGSEAIRKTADAVVKATAAQVAAVERFNDSLARLSTNVKATAAGPLATLATGLEGLSLVAGGLLKGQTLGQIADEIVDLADAEQQALADGFANNFFAAGEREALLAAAAAVEELTTEEERLNESLARQVQLRVALSAAQEQAATRNETDAEKLNRLEKKREELGRDIRLQERQARDTGAPEDFDIPERARQRAEAERALAATRKLELEIELVGVEAEIEDLARALKEKAFDDFVEGAAEAQGEVEQRSRSRAGLQRSVGSSLSAVGLAATNVESGPLRIANKQLAVAEDQLEQLVKILEATEKSGGGGGGTTTLGT